MVSQAQFLLFVLSTFDTEINRMSIYKYNDIYHHTLQLHYQQVMLIQGLAQLFLIEIALLNNYQAIDLYN